MKEIIQGRCSGKGMEAVFGLTIMRSVWITLFAFVVVSCGSPGEVPQVESGANTAGADGGTAVQAPVIESSETPSDPGVIREDWAAGPHADTYVLSEEGKNSTCAACHAPVQWVPSMEDMPESCTSCKFEVDPPPPVITEADWTHVECKVCHTEKRGEIQPEVLWLEIAPIEEYADVSSHSELCLKCHRVGEVTGHVGVQVQGDHQGYECTECHQAHNVEASCTATGCHPDALSQDTGIYGHDEAHALVGCEACHDAGDLRVGPDSETGEWTTFVPAEPGSGDWRPFVSHNTSLEVDCERCHYEDNPWDLTLDIETADDGG